MANYRDLKFIRRLSIRGDTNSQVDLMQDEETGNHFVRKTIYGVEQPLYKAIFMREIRALYKLNRSSNIVRIFFHNNMKETRTNEIVGCIYLEYIIGDTLQKTNLVSLSSKDKFNILKQLLNAIEVAHSNGIIHRDINPNNIMITEQKDLKVIDFGICKIKEMISSSTLFKLGTNLYSAPEVHLHSANATERSDLYSIGAVTYYLFTGAIPPIATEFQYIIENASGIDIDLKPIIKKLVMVNPEERYKDIFELRVALSTLFNRFLNKNQQINISLDTEKFQMLKYRNLIPRNAKYADTHFISQNFNELYVFKDDTDLYLFLGLNYMLICIYDSDRNIFLVADVRKVVPVEREQYKRKYIEIGARVQIIDLRFAHRQVKNDCIEIKNIIDSHYADYMSKNNVDSQYKNKYGAWRELLNITKKSIEENIVRFSYDSIYSKDGILSFILCKGVFLGDAPFSREQIFVFEKPARQKNKVTPLLIGYYEDDYFENDHVVLKVRYDRNIPHLPPKGSICLDYRKDMANVQRQLDALDTLEKEDYSCPFNLKSIISGIENPKMRVLEDEIKFFNGRLDMSQQSAVKKALNSESLAIIQGPPGTGKTYVIIEIIRQILKANKRNPELPEKKILLVSQSHPAVDKMLDDLIDQSPERPNLIRIGRDEKLNSGIREEYGFNFVKDRWVKTVREKCDIISTRLCEELSITKDVFNQYYREFEKLQIANLEENEINLNVISDMKDKTNTLRKDKVRKILEIQKQWVEQLPKCEEVDLYITKSTTIIAGTCIGFISNRVIRDADFDYLIIDEAARATFPELAVSLNKASRIILVGDHKQLPPVLDDEIIEKNKHILDLESLSAGIFEKLYDSFPDSNKHRLSVQYRMHQAIGTLISHVFYKDDIQNGKEINLIGIDGYSQIAIEWLSTSAYTDKERYEKQEGVPPRLTYRNDLELKLIKEKLAYLDKNIISKTKVAVITAYSAQKYALCNMIKQQSYKNLLIEVDTVDAFQGSQREVVIYSAVRSSNNSFKIGFLRSEARLNVAFSRAQSLLIIVGDHAFLNNRAIPQNKFPDIIDYINECEFCRIVDCSR